MSHEVAAGGEGCYILRAVSVEECDAGCSVREKSARPGGGKGMEVPLKD